MRGFDNQRYGKEISKEKYEQIVAKQIRYQEKKNETKKSK